MKTYQFSILPLLMLSLTSCVSVSSTSVRTPETRNFGVEQLNDQSVMAVDWMQTAAEYRALCYQAYNIASLRVDQALAARNEDDKPLAVVSDADETLLNNSPYQAGMIGTDRSYNRESWTQWENTAVAEALPGAVEFAQSLADRGVELFYVTNRNMEGRDGTIKNLRALGFPFADEEHVLVKTRSSDKQPRFDSVLADYDVVVFMGDNEGDFPIDSYGKNMETRNGIVDAHSDDFGKKFIVLPNPAYGNWESAMAEDYWSLTPAEKDAARKAVLKSWNPSE